MMRYTWKRILTGIVSLFLLATVTFFLVRLIPGSPFQRGGVSEQVVEAVEEEYGLNDPLIEQYLSYMGNLLKGDLGISYQDPGTSVEEIIGRAAPLTVSLGLSALIVSVIVGTGCGVFYAASEKRAVKKVIGSLGMLAAGIPGFAAAILLLMVFSVKLKWFPSSGLFSFSCLLSHHSPIHPFSSRQHQSATALVFPSRQKEFQNCAGRPVPGFH